MVIRQTAFVMFALVSLGLATWAGDYNRGQRERRLDAFTAAHIVGGDMTADRCCENIPTCQDQYANACTDYTYEAICTIFSDDDVDPTVDEACWAVDPVGICFGPASGTPDPPCRWVYVCIWDPILGCYRGPPLHEIPFKGRAFCFDFGCP